MHRYRSHTCGALHESDIGKVVRLAGWCHRIRDHGGVLFIDLRDHYGLAQVVADPDSKAFKLAETLRAEWVVRIDGKVRKRPAGTENPDLPTGQVEVYIDEIEVLGPAAELPMPVFGEQEYPEEIRLKYRFLDLRREHLHNNIMTAVTGFVVLIPRRSPRNPMAEIEHALDAGEFIPYYQPVVDIRSGQLRGAEVLVRWRKPDGTLVLPGAFIPLMESSDLIDDLTRHLMRKVCTEVGPALGRRPDLTISFNFAGKLFSEPSIVKDVRNIFVDSPIKFSQVVLEVTERDPIENFTETRQTIAALQGLGVRIAIDDVGTGHSGLSYMLKLGVDIIKIDKMFVDAIGTDRNSTTIVETLVDLARNMVWRAPNEAGIAFLNEYNQDVPVPLEWAKRLRDREAENAALRKRIKQLSESGGV